MGTRVEGRNPATPFTATIENVSLSGCKLVETTRLIPEGSTVLLDLTSRIAVVGQVVWSRNHAIGIRFHEALSEAQVSELTEQQAPTANGEWLAVDAA